MRRSLPLLLQCRTNLTATLIVGSTVSSEEGVSQNGMQHDPRIRGREPRVRQPSKFFAKEAENESSDASRDAAGDGYSGTLSKPGRKTSHDYADEPQSKNPGSARPSLDSFRYTCAGPKTADFAKSVTDAGSSNFTPKPVISLRPVHASMDSLGYQRCKDMSSNDLSSKRKVSSLSCSHAHLFHVLEYQVQTRSSPAWCIATYTCLHTHDLICLLLTWFVYVLPCTELHG